MTEEGDFSFQWDNTWRDSSVSPEIGAAIEVGEWPERKGVIDWLSQHCAPCILSITCGPFPLLLSFLQVTGDRLFPKDSLPDLCPSFNFITVELTSWQSGGQTASFDPACLLSPGDTFPAIIHPWLPTLLCSFHPSFLCLLCQSLSFPHASPVRQQKQLSSIDNSFDRPQWRALSFLLELIALPLPSRSPSCLSVRGEKMSGCEWEVFHLPLLISLQSFLTPAKTTAVFRLNTVWPCRQQDAHVMPHEYVVWIFIDNQ